MHKVFWVWLNHPVWIFSSSEITPYDLSEQIADCNHIFHGENKVNSFGKLNPFFIFHFQALIHVSTAYCNCDREEVAEIIYTPPYDPQKIIEMMEWMDDSLVDTLTPG